MSLTYKEALLLLGLPAGEQDPPPTLDAVRRAFRQQALRWHPDKQRQEASSSSGSDPCSHGIAEAAPKAAAPAQRSHQGHGDTRQQCSSSSSSSPRNAGSSAAEGRPSQAAAEEHFKRLASAYHVLLHAASSSSSHSGAAAEGTSGAPGGSSGAGAAAGPAEASPRAAAATAAAAYSHADDDDLLADSVSADLLLQEASKLRLSEFDMMFLHQRASGGGSGLAAVWPESALSADDIWRRIRRRVERRRRRRAALQGVPDTAGGLHSGPGTQSKWALLFEFVADMVGTPAEALTPPQQQATAASAAASGASARANGPNRVSPPHDETQPTPSVADLHAEASGRGPQHPQPQPSPQQQLPLPAVQHGCVGQGAVVPSVAAAAAAATAAEADAAGSELPEQGRRQRGRLPAGFYWRWCRRLLVARLLFMVLFRS